MEFVSEFLTNSPWIVDVILRYHLGEVHEHAVEVLYDAVEAQRGDVSYRMLGKIVRRIRRHPDEFKSQAFFVEIGMKRCTERLGRFFHDETRDAYDIWVPNALQLAALPLIDRAFHCYIGMVETSYTTISTALEKSSQAMLHPETLIHVIGTEDGEGGLDLSQTRVGLQSVMATIEIDMQIVVGTSRLFDGDDAPKPGDEEWNSMQELIGDLLTIRWELDQFSSAIGSSDTFRVHVPWDFHLGIDLVSFLVDCKTNILLLTPPQITLALEMLNASSHGVNKGDVGDCLFDVLRHVLQASIEGIFHPKDIISEKATTRFANMAQRLRVSLSKDDRFKSLLTERENGVPDGGEMDGEDKVPMKKAKTGEDVDKFLSMIGCAGGTKSTPRSVKKAKKIVAQRVGDTGGDDKVKAEKGMSEETFVAPYHHKGRVIMPATYNLDSDAREVLWQAYMADKDTLVEMLGDSKYQDWHDESQTRSRRRKSGVENAFDAVFGESIAKTEAESEIKEGRLVEAKAKSLLESSLVFPWQSLLSEVIMYISRMARTSKDTKRLLCILVDEKARMWAVNASLKSMHPGYSRPLWKCCCDIVSENPIIGFLLYMTYQMKRVFISTTRHTIEQLPASFLEIIGIAVSDGALQLKSKYSTSPITMAENLIRSCMAFPPLLGSSVNSLSAKMMPPLCGLGMDTDVILYMSSCCYAVWQSLKGSKGSVFWLSKEYDFFTHPVCTASALAKCQFITSGLEVISQKIQQIGEDSVDVISALLASSSLSVSMAVEICKIIGSPPRRVVKMSQPIFTLVCGQRNLNLNLLSVISALCEIYCGLTEDWEEFLLASAENASIPHTASIAFGCDFADGCIAYVAAMREAHLVHGISNSVLVRIESIVVETKKRLEIILHAIQNLDKDSDVYKTIIEEITKAPEIIVLDSNMTTGPSKATVSRAKEGRRIKDVINPFVKAILQESGKQDDDYVEDDLSDLEDFIVANPEVDYVEFIDNHFPLDNSHDSD